MNTLHYMQEQHFRLFYGNCGGENEIILLNSQNKVDGEEKEDILEEVEPSRKRSICYCKTY